jgi:hypothetical protein
VILLAGYSLFSVARTWVLVRDTWNPDLISNDPVSMWQRRIARIKWPDNIGREVGYMADWDIDPTYDPIGQDEEYVLTQYSLAPLIVKRGDGPEWIVGNLTLPGADDWLSQKYPGAKIHYYGWGIYLIHKLKP